MPLPTRIVFAPGCTKRHGAVLLLCERMALKEEESFEGRDGVEVVLPELGIVLEALLLLFVALPHRGGSV